MLCRSALQLLKRSYGVRYMATSVKIDLYEQMETYPYLNTFLFTEDDPIKQRWEFLKDWSMQCESNPEVEETQFKVIRQRYELTPLYEDESITEHNAFLKDIFERIKDPEEEGQINRKTLTDKQFEVTKRVMNQHITVNGFILKIPELMENAEDSIRELKYKTFDFIRFEKQVQAWATYRFLSYGHPKPVELYQKMIDAGDLSPDEIRDVVHYMKKQNQYGFYNKEFKNALKWLSKMNWVFDHAPDLFAGNIVDHFVWLYGLYERMKEVLENEETLERCTYNQTTKEGAKLFRPEPNDIEIWLKDISKKDNDPLVVWLKEKLCSDVLFEELQNAIVNRYQLDIGGLFDTHETLLKSLLHNKHLHQLQPDVFDRERHNVLIGTELTTEYLDELKVIIESAQQEFKAQRK